MLSRAWLERDNMSQLVLSRANLCFCLSTVPVFSGSSA